MQYTFDSLQLIGFKGLGLGLNPLLGRIGFRGLGFRAVGFRVHEFCDWYGLPVYIYCRLAGFAVDTFWWMQQGSLEFGAVVLKFGS